MEFQVKAIALVEAYIRTHLDKSDPEVTFEVYVVWFCKTLGNWKALLSSTLMDSTYYEVTYDGNNQRTYIDVYKKWQNLSVPDEDV